MSKAADAVYPHLAGKDADLPKRVGEQAKPDWASTNDPLWSEPRQIPNGLDRVPGLIRKPANRR
jgi:hypothetical protein